MPDAAYAPPGGKLSIVAVSEAAEVALCWAPATRGSSPALLPGSDVNSVTRRSDRTERTIHNILMEDRPAESLLVTEVLTPAGNWSRWLVTTDPDHRWQLG
jgi:5-deoxy-glucuronate isomerase